MFIINSFKDFNLILEDKLWIWAKPFRIDDLFNSGLFKESHIFNMMRRHSFHRWSVGAFVSKKKLNKKSDITRFSERSPVKSEFGDLLDTGDIDSIETYRSEINDKDIRDKIDNLELRLSRKGVKSEIYFNSTSKAGKGELIEDSKFILGNDEIYLYIFEKNKARQINGIIYESDIKSDIGLSHPEKGERWDAFGPLVFSYLQKKLELGNKLYLNNDELLDFNLIPKEFLKRDNNWSIKSCSNSKNANIYFGDFKRISGLEKDGDKLKLVDKDLKNFILVVGFHTKGQFIQEYIINVKLDNWRKLIPDMSNHDVISKLEQMYSELGQHRLGTKSNTGKRTGDTENSWKKYCATYRKITEKFGIKLNFKRDTKGQLRIQCSMNKSVFHNFLLKNNDYILIKY